MSELQEFIIPRSSTEYTINPYKSKPTVVDIEIKAKRGFTGGLSERLAILQPLKIIRQQRKLQSLFVGRYEIMFWLYSHR